MKLILKDLGFGYKGQVLSDFINLELNDCDYIVILGENGSGKSSLIKTILGLNKKISGEIIMEGISKDGNRLSTTDIINSSRFSNFDYGARFIRL